MHENQSRSSQLEGTSDDLAGVYRRVINRASLLHFVLDQRVLAIEKQYMKFLYLAVSELRVTVVNQLVPRTDHSPLTQLRPHEPQSDLTDKFHPSYCG